MKIIVLVKRGNEERFLTEAIPTSNKRFCIKLLVLNKMIIFGYINLVHTLRNEWVGSVCVSTSLFNAYGLIPISSRYTHS